MNLKVPSMPSIASNSSLGCKRSRGFTLIEVLVALVVLSIGLLGMAKLVMVSSHANDSAYLRSQATALAYQMTDNMRANLAGAAVAQYDTALTATPSAPTSCVGTATQCTNSQLAQWNVYSWKQNLLTALPSGAGSIVTSGTSPTTATIVVQWDDAAGQSAFGAVNTGVAANMQIVLETVLQ